MSDQIQNQSDTKLNPVDPRDITHDQIATATNAQADSVAISDRTVPKLPVMNQNPFGTCPNYDAVRLLKAWWYDKTGVIVDFSPRFLVILSKQKDGTPDSQGTYPRIPMGILFNIGCCTTALLPDDRTLSWEEYSNPNAITPAMLEEAKNYKIPGYVTITNADRDGIREALSKYKRIGITLPMGDFSSNRLLPPVMGKGGILQLHRITLYADTPLPVGNDGIESISNQWGTFWGDSGFGNFLFSDFSGMVYDIMAIADVPAPVIRDARKKSPNRVVISRVAGTKQTQGTITVTTPTGNVWKAFTLERPWLDNQRNISCVPEGTYDAVQTYMGVFKKNFYKLMEVPARDGIFIHPGNHVSDTDGCILIGDSFTDLNADGLVDVTNTIATIQKLTGLMEGLPFTLEITHEFLANPFGRTLRKNDWGDDVKALQKALGITADGKFGSITEKAVREFQAVRGLTPDGVAGPKTQARLIEVINKK